MLYALTLALLLATTPAWAGITGTLATSGGGSFSPVTVNAVTNQTTVSGSPFSSGGSFTVGTVQDINTTSTPTLGGLTLGAASSLTGTLLFKNAANANTVTLQAGTTSGNVTFKLPTADGANGACMITDGAGQLSLSLTCGGAAGGISSLGGQTGSTQTFANDTNVTMTSASNVHTLGWTGTLGLARGGCHADLSATGGTSKFLKQASVGADCTVVQPAIADLSDASNIALLNAANVFSSATGQSVKKLLLPGSTSGTLTVLAAAAAGTTTLTLPGGTTDFSATGGTSQVVKQTSAGGAFTVAQLAFTDLSGSLACAQHPALTGDVTTSACAATIAAGVVTNAKLATVATATFKARTTAGTGAPEDLTVTQATALLNVFTSALKGLAPSSGGGTTNFLRADGTWASPPGGAGTVTTSGSPASGNLTKFSGAASITNGDLSGDATTSGTLAVTVVNVNGVAYPASPSTNTVPVVTGVNTITYQKVPNTALANSAITINGVSVSLGGTRTLASTDLSDTANLARLNAANVFTNQVGVKVSAASAIIEAADSSANAVFGFRLNATGTNGRDWRFEQGRSAGGQFNITDCSAGCAPRLTFSSAGALTLPAYGLGVLHSSAGGAVTSSAVVLTSEVSGILPRLNGGWGSDVSGPGATGIVSFNSGTPIFNNVLTANRLLYAAAGNTVTSNSGLTFDGSIMTVTTDDADTTMIVENTQSDIFAFPTALQLKTLRGNLIRGQNSGSGITVFSVTASGAMGIRGTLSIGGTTSGSVQLAAPVSGASGTYTLPSGDGTNSQVLTTNGGGVLSWTDKAGGGGVGILSLNSQTGNTQTFTSDTNVTMTSASNNHALGWAGTLARTRGGWGSDVSGPGATGVVSFDAGVPVFGGAVWAWNATLSRQTQTVTNTGPSFANSRPLLIDATSSGVRVATGSDFVTANTISGIYSKNTDSSTSVSTALGDRTAVNTFIHSTESSGWTGTGIAGVNLYEINGSSSAGERAALAGYAFYNSGSNATVYGVNGFVGVASAVSTIGVSVAAGLFELNCQKAICGTKAFGIVSQNITSPFGTTQVGAAGLFVLNATTDGGSTAAWTDAFRVANSVSSTTPVFKVDNDGKVQSGDGSPGSYTVRIRGGFDTAGPATGIGVQGYIKSANASPDLAAVSGQLTLLNGAGAGGQNHAAAFDGVVIKQTGASASAQVHGYDLVMSSAVAPSDATRHVGYGANLENLPSGGTAPGGTAFLARGAIEWSNGFLYQTPGGLTNFKAASDGTVDARAGYKVNAVAGISGSVACDGAGHRIVFSGGIIIDATGCP